MGATNRNHAIIAVTDRSPISTEPGPPLSEIWATDVFSIATMEERLSKNAFKAMKETVRTGAPLDPRTADVVAAAMKDWALGKGAKFFSHVFFPLTNITAEKHDGFIVTNADGHAITEFTGSLLIKGEPDGSSFPNGSLRMTNEARGYTAWDPTSPVYIVHTPNGATLMIPSVFVSWTGESLDKKIPLLRSNDAMDRAARRVLTLMGETDIEPLQASCGAEQEYFLVDAHFANTRPDLLLCGRTLFGAPSPKGQEFDDHYFGAIPARVQVFMQDVEDQLFRLGVPIKTRHNEVAPGQFELAPYHENANVAADHQQLTMTVMKATAKKHGFLCLLHEKPFAGLNGSGKHVNWSVGNSTQGNLLDPGRSPHENLHFLLFCGAVIRGVHLFGPLLRSVIASAANDHRLGANEAPPAILSVYLGDQLEGVFNDIKHGNPHDLAVTGLMDLGLSQIVPFTRDPGDRNRTSPFAFTGNRFEFRAVGSSHSIAGPLTAMNAMLADSLDWIADQLEAELADGVTQLEAVASVLKDLMERHGDVIFGGDGYSPEWHRIAVDERGLRNLPTAADALPVLQEQAVIELLERTNIMSAAELQSRYEVYSEQYIMSIGVESRLMVEMATTTVYPAALDVSGRRRLHDHHGSTGRRRTRRHRCPERGPACERTDVIGARTAEEAVDADDFDTPLDHMRYCASTLCPMMDEVRSHADALEAEVADRYWPLPKYREMLFIK